MLPVAAAAFQKEHLRKLADGPNTTVYDVVYDRVSDPWTVERLRPVFERIVHRVTTEFRGVDHFDVSKRLLEDEEILAFQRQHPKLYWMMTDKKMIEEPTFRGALSALLGVRAKVDAGELEEDEANALATRAVLATMGVDLTSGGPSGHSPPTGT